MKIRRKRKDPSAREVARRGRFTLRAQVGAWILLYDEDAPEGAKDRWYVVDLRDRSNPNRIFGPYFKATAEAVLEALVKVARERA